MISKNVLQEIDKAIKGIWLNEIVKDYEECSLLKEDSLKCSLYHHLRNRLGKLLEENHLRIYPEFYFPALKYRADIAIVELDPDSQAIRLVDRVKAVIAIFELKYDGGTAKGTTEFIKNDVWKIKDYIQSGKLLCQYYFAVIYETESSTLNWLDKRSSKHWAKGYVTELNAGFIGDEMWFEVNSYNGMNEEEFER